MDNRWIGVLNAMISSVSFNEVRGARSGGHSSIAAPNHSKACHLLCILQELEAVQSVNAKSGTGDSKASKKLHHRF
jgi:hypothetical protein